MDFYVFFFLFCFVVCFLMFLFFFFFVFHYFRLLCCGCCCLSVVRYRNGWSFYALQLNGISAAVINHINTHTHTSTQLWYENITTTIANDETYMRKPKQNYYVRSKKKTVIFTCSGNCCWILKMLCFVSNMSPTYTYPDTTHLQE